jgi:hypothetical protein
MGSHVELNDTLKLKRGQGFPSNIEEGGTYDFSIDGRRLYNLNPSRVFLVEEVDGRWNYIGHAVVLRQMIDTETEKTSGQFKVIKVYPRDYALSANRFEAPAGKAYDDKP